MSLSSSSPRLSRRLSLASTQAKSNVLLAEEEEGASLLMDMSLAELKKSSPVKRKRRQINEDELDKLSQDELELLAWEAMEEERRLEEKKKGSKRRSSKPDDEMKNITVRQKSNSPRKTLQVDESRKDCFAPLPRSTSTSAIKHSYDRQASPSRSALRRPQARKSVAFGEVAEYEISVGGSEISERYEHHMDLELSSDSGVGVVMTSSSSSQPIASEKQSSSPLSRFTTSRTPLPAAKVLFKSTIAAEPAIRCSPRIKQARKPEEVTVIVKPKSARKSTSKLSPKSPIAKTRQREAVLESSAKARIKARQSAVKMQTKAKEEVKVPNGFRLSSTGTLLAQPRSNPFTATSATIVPRRQAPFTRKQGSTAPRANPVPAWLTRRKNALLKEEEERLQKELERVRAEELGPDEDKSNEKKKRRPTAQPSYTSAVEKRIAERATWEAKRKANEDLITQEKAKARKKREEREEEAYRLARQKSVIRANPVPHFVHSRAAK